MRRYQKELTKIKKILKGNPKGMSVKNIAQTLNTNRNTVAKYLDVLQISGYVEKDDFGTAKVYTLSRHVPISTMLNFSTDCVVIVDKDHKIIHANDTFLDFAEEKRKNVIDKKIENTSLSMFNNHNTTSMIDGAIDGEEATSEINITLDEKEFYFRIKYIPTVCENGETGITLVSEDITERKKIEEQLWLERFQLISIFDNLNEYICIIDPKNSTILYANKKIRKAIGEDPVGQTCYEKLRDIGFPCDSCTAYDDLKRKKRPYERRLHNPKTDGEILIMGSIIDWPEKNVKLEVITELSQQKKM